MCHTPKCFDINEISGKRVAEELNKQFSSDGCVFVSCDVTKADDLEHVLATASSNFGPVDLFVNNAGIMSESQWSKTIEINVKSVIAGTFAAKEHMRKDKGGRGGQIINISSIGGIVPMSYFPSYCATKSAVLGFTRSMAAGYDDRQRVRYNCFCPTITDTPLIRTRDVYQDYGKLKASIDAMGLKSVEEVATALLDLASNSEANGAVAVQTSRDVRIQYDHGLTSKM